MEVLKQIGLKFSKLIDVKSIVTIFTTIIFGVLTLRGSIPQEFLSVYLIVIGFYFGTQYQKTENTVNKAETSSSESGVE